MSKLGRLLSDVGVDHCGSVKKTSSTLFFYSFEGKRKQRFYFLVEIVHDIVLVVSLPMKINVSLQQVITVHQKTFDRVIVVVVHDVRMFRLNTEKSDHSNLTSQKVRLINSNV